MIESLLVEESALLLLRLIEALQDDCYEEIQEDQVHEYDIAVEESQTFTSNSTSNGLIPIVHIIIIG